MTTQYNTRPSSRAIPSPYGTALITASVTASNSVISAGMFEFGLYDSSGSLISTATNDANGAIRFPEITYDRVGSDDYTIRQLSVNHNDWLIDNTIYPVRVVVVNSGGALRANVTYPNGSPVFNNTYGSICSDSGMLSITACMRVFGGCIRPFEFALLNPDGSIAAQVCNDRCGNIEFPKIMYTDVGTYNYVIQQTTKTGGGWITDRSKFGVKVEVTRKSDGTLDVKVSYPNGKPRFTNRCTR